MADRLLDEFDAITDPIEAVDWLRKNKPNYSEIVKEEWQEALDREWLGDSIEGNAIIVDRSSKGHNQQTEHIQDANLDVIESAWGPERVTYLKAAPAEYAVFNSITDNTEIGDERSFVRVREIGEGTSYQKKVNVTPGKEYEVCIYYYNDAREDANAVGFGIATATKISSTYPECVSNDKSGAIVGKLSWSYVTPAQPNDPKIGRVWDTALLETDFDNVVLKYKAGSAIIHNDGGKANNSVLSTNLFSSDGTYVGYNVLKGNVPGGPQYAGHITFTLIAEKTPSLSLKGSIDGEKWTDTVLAKPGQIITYKVEFRNTGNTTLNNVAFKESHDAGLSLRLGSTRIYNMDYIDGIVVDDVLDSSGYNMGNVGLCGLRQIIFQSKVDEDETLIGKSLENAVTVSYNDGEQQSAVVQVCIIK